MLTFAACWLAYMSRLCFFEYFARIGIKYKNINIFLIDIFLSEVESEDYFIRHTKNNCLKYKELLQN